MARGRATNVRLTRAHARPYARLGPAPSLGRRPGHRLCCTGLRQARYLPHRADRSRRGHRLDDRPASLLRDRSRTPGIDRARRPARGPAHRHRRRRPRGRRHQPLRLRAARARARRRARGRRLVAGGAGRRDLRRGRQARSGSAGHAPPRRAPAARHPLQRPRLGAPAQAAVRAGRARPVPPPAADLRRRAGRRAAARTYPARSPRSRNATCSSARSSPSVSACVPSGWPTSRRRSITSPP